MLKIQRIVFRFPFLVFHLLIVFLFQSFNEVLEPLDEFGVVLLQPLHKLFRAHDLSLRGVLSRFDDTPLLRIDELQLPSFRNPKEEVRLELLNISKNLLVRFDTILRVPSVHETQMRQELLRLNRP